MRLGFKLVQDFGADASAKLLENIAKLTGLPPSVIKVESAASKEATATIHFEDKETTDRTTRSMQTAFINAATTSSILGVPVEGVPDIASALPDGKLSFKHVARCAVGPAPATAAPMVEATTPVPTPVEAAAPVPTPMARVVVSGKPFRKAKARS